MKYRRQLPKRKPRRPVAEIIRDRHERTTEALIACVSEMARRHGPGAITHRVVAERIGVPVRYVEWKYPSVETLLAMAEASRVVGA